MVSLNHGFFNYRFWSMDSLGLIIYSGKKRNGFRTGLPDHISRSDLKVMIGDFAVAPGLALTSWIGIYSMGHESMMMGDLVLRILKKDQP